MSPCFANNLFFMSPRISEFLKIFTLEGLFINSNLWPIIVFNVYERVKLF